MADKVKISVIIDNYIDIFLPAGGPVEYPFAGAGSRLLAEQGLSLGVEVWNAENVIRILYDFGRSANVFPHNAALLNIDLAHLDHLVLSHGHIDHYGALQLVLDNTERSPLYFHPAAGRKRYVQPPVGDMVGPWEIPAELFSRFESRITRNIGPLHIASDTILSGEIRRQTDFEVGMPNAFAEVGGLLVHDDIPDDQALFVDLQGRGIVVITGCCHAGVVNTVLHAQELFTGRPVYAVIGGFHLNAAKERQMKETVKFLRALNIHYLAGLHCTGYWAARRLMDEFHDQWIPGTVGAKIIL